MRLTKQQFIDRFNAEEMAGILAAAKVSPSVESWLFRFNSVTPDPDGTSIDTTDARTVMGLHSMESAGLLAAGRAADILCLGHARVLPPFAEAYPGTYEIAINLAGGATLDGIGDFAEQYIERIA